MNNERKMIQATPIVHGFLKPRFAVLSSRWFMVVWNKAGYLRVRLMAFGLMRILLFVVVLLMKLDVPASRLSAGDVVQVGNGSYTTTVPSGGRIPPTTLYVTERVKAPIPTNTWWSSVVWMPFSERQYPHPLSVRARADGLQVYNAGPHITANENAILATMPDGGFRDVVIGHTECASFADARLDGFSDWFVSVKFQSDDAGMRVTYGHGSPYIFGVFEGGGAELRFTEPPRIWSGTPLDAIIGFTINDCHYAAFAKSGSTWNGLNTAKWSNQDELGRPTRVSIAVLPDNRNETLQLFSRYAYNEVSNTKCHWTYASESGTVSTTFKFETEDWPSSHERGQGTLFAMYPHQWVHTQHELLPYSYPTVRGTMKLAAGDSFTTKMTFAGVLPLLPPSAPKDPLLQQALEESAQEMTPTQADTYVSGKRVARLADLCMISELQGDKATMDTFRRELAQIMEAWLGADETQSGPPSPAAFHYNATWGTLIGYPASHGTDTELNDHHIHIGYFLRGAAELARADPEWAALDEWGGMIDLLIRDIACFDRNDEKFPFVRCFDAYAGHSWASGHAMFADGNNSESSSESIHTWYALILWGEATRNDALRDLGVCLYTTEVAAAHNYWFDVLHRNHPPAYPRPVVGQIWGGKGAYGTWFSAEPSAIYGINWLPFHGGSLYLGHYRRHVLESYHQLRDGSVSVVWLDLILMFLALDDAAEARRQFNDLPADFAFEEGTSRAQVLYWIRNLEVLGTLRPEITADHPLAIAFIKDGMRTYVTYNMHDEPLTVTFSDGTKFISASSSFTLYKAP